jgi:DNA repair protein RadD
MLELKNILERYSVGELSSFLGGNILGVYQATTSEEVSKDTLVEAVLTLYGHEIFIDPSMREKLIDRMSGEQVEEALALFLADYSDDIEITAELDRYQALIDLSRRWPHRFASLFGYGDGLGEAESVLSSVAGLTRVEPDYPAYPYQQAMVLKVDALMRSGDKKCLLHLPTGAGKTRTAMNIAAEHLRHEKTGLVLWLADTSELCSQAANEFTKAWRSLGNRDVKLYSYYSDTNISLGGIDQGFLVAGLQKLNAARGSAEYRILYEQLKKHVTLIIFDEAHKAIAPTYAQAVQDMTNARNNTFLLGLSATPGRQLDVSSDEDERLSGFFDGTKVTMQVAGYESPINYLVEQNYLAKADFINIDYDAKKIVLADAFSSASRSLEIRQALSEDESRNLRLLEVIEEEYSDGSSIIVFACSVEHSRDLASMLAFRGILAFSLDSKNDDSDTRRFKIAQYTSGKVRVLINFNILTAGFDAPKTNVAIIARPTDSLVQYSQMAGRAMRGERSGGSRKCKIYTVRDDIPAFRSVARAFMHWDTLWNEV